VNGAEGERVERYLVLFRHAGREKPAGTFDEFEAALAEKQRADRAKREGKLDDYAAGLLTEPDARRPTRRDVGTSRAESSPESRSR
jgi:hypothetical protein